jgi:hypothetical protein
MESTVHVIAAGERDAAEKRVRQELGGELKQLAEIKKDNELLRVGDSHSRNKSGDLMIQ